MRRQPRLYSSARISKAYSKVTFRPNYPLSPDAIDKSVDMSCDSIFMNRDKVKESAFVFPNPMDGASEFIRSLAAKARYLARTAEKLAVFGAIGEYEIQIKSNQQQVNYFHLNEEDPDYKEVDYKELLDRIKIVKDINNIDEFMAIVNSPAIIRKLTSTDAWLEFLAVHLAYVDMVPGLIIENPVLKRNGDPFWCEHYIITRTMTNHYNGFFSFLLQPYNCNNKDAPSIVVPRGTYIYQSLQSRIKDTCSGIFMNVDPYGVAYSVAQSATFKDGMAEFLNGIKGPIIFTGHSLGGALSLRMLNDASDDMFRLSRAVIFNSPGVANIPKLEEHWTKIKEYITVGDIVSLYPFRFKRQHKTISRECLVDTNPVLRPYILHGIAIFLNLALDNNVKCTLSHEGTEDQENNLINDVHS